MKLNVTVELDWLSEEGSIDEQIQSKIAEEISNKISESSLNSLSGIADKLINERASKLVDGVFENIMNQSIDITDNWGTVVKTYVNTQEMIKSRFDTFMLDKVDDQGNKSSYGNFTRMDFLIKKQIDNSAKQFTQQAVKSVLSDDLKAALGDRLINMMELDKMLTKKLNP